MPLVPKLATIDDLLQGRCGEVAVGDVLAFYGASKVDEFIQGATKSAISHVAILMREKADGPFEVLEATGLGVTRTPLAESLAKYDQEQHVCFYLPLVSKSRALVVPEALAAFYEKNAFDKYNYDGVVEAGIYDLDHPLFDKFLHFFHGRSLWARLTRRWYRLAGRMSRVWHQVITREPAVRRLFCSQLVTEVLQKVKVLPVPPKARLVVPVEVCWFDIYAGAYQLNGGALRPDPFRWGDAPAAQAGKPAPPAPRA
ncbi:MAG TPA: hypothetical protein VHO06_00935 [Polyangia bacterium]|nr:hypothetical protein [Polyangia bacterium]